MIDTTKLRELAQSIAGKPRSEKRTEYPRDAMEQYIDAAHPFVILALLDEIDRLRTIEVAARNLAKVKGRHHSEQATNQLLEALKEVSKC